MDLLRQPGAGSVAGTEQTGADAKQLNCHFKRGTATPSFLALLSHFIPKLLTVHCDTAFSNSFILKSIAKYRTAKLMDFFLNMKCFFRNV